MKKFLMTVLAVLCLFSAFEAAAAKSKKKAKKKTKKITVQWQNDINKAFAEAKKSKKLILLVLNATKPSTEAQNMEKAVFGHKNFGRYAKNLVLVKTDYQKLQKMGKKMPAVWQKYPPEKSGNTDIYPTVYLLDSTGKTLEKFSNTEAKNPSDFLKNFKQLKK